MTPPLPRQIRSLLDRQIVRYALAGGTAAATHIVLLAVFVEMFGIAQIAASVTAFCIAHALNYLMQYHLTFRANTPHTSAATRFMAVTAVTFTLNAALFTVLSMGLYYVLAQAVTLAVIFVVNFVLNRRFTFRRIEARDAPPARATAAFGDKPSQSSKAE